MDDVLPKTSDRPMMAFQWRMLLLAVCFAASSFSIVRSAPAEEPSPEAAEFFEREIRPLLVEHCHTCHGDGDDAEGGLQLINRQALLAGGASGPAAIESKPEESLLIRAVRYDGLQMPPDAKLPQSDIDKLVRWVEMGLPWPGSENAPDEVKSPAHTFEITPEQREFWSFQPVKDPPVPGVKDHAQQAKTDIDRFVLEKLEDQGLSFSAPADKRTLLRRVTYDLTGLPPTPEEMNAFLADDSPEAFAKVVDRLLASPRYGEHWGRHWLDLVRYADSRDSRGIGGDSDIGEAWRYRDWVVRALNADLPYNQFTEQQIAGDLLPDVNGAEFNVDGLIATGLLTIGEWGTGDSDKEKMMTDIVDDQVNVVSATFMGLTVACARCHDHKFDPISAADYYALAGIFFSTHIIPSPGPKTAGSPMLRTPLLSPKELAAREHDKQRVAQLETELAQAKAKYNKQFAQSELSRTADYLMAAWEYRNSPAAAAQPVAAFANKHKLQGEVLRRWSDLLGLGDVRLLTTFQRDVAGIPGMVRWVGEGDVPSLMLNTTAALQTFSTIRMPAHCVSVHPSPSAGVAAAWRSPIVGTLSISAKMADADPNCGDGIAWTIERKPKQGPAVVLAEGKIPNGAEQVVEATLPALSSVAVAPGELIRLNILPGGEYSCDTTVIDLQIALSGADGRVWNLTRDLLQNVSQPSNPLRDSQGHGEVWFFEDGRRTTAAPNLTAALADPLKQWTEALAQPGDYEATRAAALAAAEIFQRSINSSPALQDALTSSESPYFLQSAGEHSVLPAEASAHLVSLQTELDSIRQRINQPVPVALAAQEGGVPESVYQGIKDSPIMLRGSYQRLGPIVPRGFPEILRNGPSEPITSGSGRLELAKWITRPEHPLTARVMVNRIWQYHFGEGLVRTPSNYGKLGEAPTHPELLDYLATRFIESGWSIKAMHRAMLLSAVYQQSSVASDELLERDPENRLWGRMNRRRLDAEGIRDSLLAASAQLDTTMEGPSVQDLSSPRRTLYLMTIRSTRSGFRVLFDAPDPEVPTPTRNVSTVAPQSLFLLNDPFVLAQTAALAKRVLSHPADTDGRIRFLYELLYARPVTDAELQIGREFVASAPPEADERGRLIAWEEYCQILLCANEFIYID